MKIFDTFKSGWKMTGASKRQILAVCVVNFLLAIVLGAAMSQTLRQSIGSSAAGEKLVAGFDEMWYPNFSQQAQGLARTFKSSITGIGAVFNGLDRFLSGDLLSQNLIVVGVGIIYLLMWTFFSAGFISLYAAPEAEQSSFFKQAAAYFPRFIVLGILAAVLYFLLFKFVLGWLTKAVDALTRETLDERVHLTYTVVKYLTFWFLVLSVNLVFDYGKILTVLKDHQNALTAPLKATKIVFANFLKTYGLYFTIGLVWVILLLVYWLVAPGAGQSSWVTITVAFLVGQLYIVSRIWTRCLFYAGQTAMCTALTTVDQAKQN